MPAIIAGIALESIWISLYWITPLRENSELFIATMMTAFAISVGSFLLIPIPDKNTALLILGFGLVFRLTALPAHPDQSEDVYRYLWDARVSVRGLDPYAYPPNAPEIKNARDTPIYDHLNSKPYLTAYPPLSQAIFRTVYSLFGERIMPMKAVFSLLEFASLIVAWRLLLVLGLSLEPLFLIAWNPFFVFEFSHSGHSDSAALFLVLLCAWLVHREKPVWAGAAGMGAVLSKLHPALWFPILLRTVGWRPLLGGAISGSFLLGFYFNASTFITYLSSLGAYVRVFEFNASVYYLMQFLAQRITARPWDLHLGSLLGAVLLGIAAIIWVRSPARNAWDMLRASFWIMTADLCLATTVHPWYLSWAAVLLFLFPFAFMTWWTGAVFLSYLAYAYRPVYEGTWILLVEYIPMYGLMAWELLRGRPLLPDLIRRSRMHNEEKEALFGNRSQGRDRRGQT